MVKNKRLFFILIAIAHALVCFLSGAIGWYNQFMIVPFAGCMAIGIVFNRISTKWYWNAVAVLPFYLVYVPASIILTSMQTYPIWIAGLLVCLLSYLLFTVKTRTGYVALLAVLVSVAGRFFLMPTYLATGESRTNTSAYKIERMVVNSGTNTAVDMSAMRGKVILLDIWSSTCGPCIKKFPDLQNLHEKYKNDTNVRIFALNVPLNFPGDREQADRLSAGYSFPKLFFANTTQAERLGIYSVPLVLIFDRHLKCRYAGGLNFGTNIYVDNVEKIIESLKKEL